MSPKWTTHKKVPYKRNMWSAPVSYVKRVLAIKEQLLNKKCSCELTERPPFKDKNRARIYYTRVYNLNTTNRIYTPSQINKISDANKTFS